MKKLLFLFVFISLSVGAQTIESHIGESIKPLGKLLEGKKGKVVIGTFKSSKSTDICVPNKGVNTKISAGLGRLGIKTSLAARSVSLDADQSEISRVIKLSGGSYIILGSYEVTGTKFKIDCTLYDHNGAGVGACDDVAATTISQDIVDSINCPKEDKPTSVVIPPPDSDAESLAPLAK
jgi:hypothetical protein